METSATWQTPLPCALIHSIARLFCCSPGPPPNGLIINICSPQFTVFAPFDAVPSPPLPSGSSGGVHGRHSHRLAVGMQGQGLVSTVQRLCVCCECVPQPERQQSQ
eukprot:GGOE01012409.1.p4 GENE.GGOE01012409.1~~GGOE01012409.1.p4  ORF type:complete len:106 (+),score=7.54 GGOE01012409.1:366-683(+)